MLTFNIKQVICVLVGGTVFIGDFKKISSRKQKSVSQQRSVFLFEATSKLVEYHN